MSKHVFFEVKKTIIFFSFLFLAIEIFGLPTRLSDTLQIKANSFFLIDSVYVHFPNDTLIITRKDQLVKEIDSEEYFYGTIRNKTNTTALGRELARLALTKQINPRKDAENGKDFSKSIEDFENYSGLIIKNIRIKTLKLIGSSVYDTTLNELQDSKMTHFINNLHRSTAESVIHSQLLFKVGDSLNPYILAENKRIIRNLNYIDDAFFYINQIGDSAEIVLVVKDKFSYGFNVNIISEKKQNIKLWNSNLLGLGNEFGLKVEHNQNDDPKVFLSEMYYKINNFRKNFITADLHYKRSTESESFSFTSERTYIPSVVNLGGGFNFEARNYLLPNWINPKILDNKALYYAANAWVGYQIQLKNIKKDKTPKFLIPAVGLNNKYYDKRPYIAADTNLFVSNYTGVLGSISFVSQSFVNTFSLLDQGHVITLPTGFSTTFTTGLVFGEFRTLPYFGIEFKTGSVSGVSSYLATMAQFGTHIYNKKMKDGLLKLDVTHYSPKIKITDNYQIRFLSSISYTLGINRNLYDSLYLNNQFGILGLNSYKFRGEHRLNGMIQVQCYTPCKFVGFRFTPFISLNAGFISDAKEALFERRLVSGYGFGIRLYNKYLVFANIQLRLMYYPNMPSGIKSFAFDLLDTNEHLFKSFTPGAPAIFEFK